MILLYIIHMKEMVNCLPMRDKRTKGRKEGRRRQGKDGAGKGRQFVPSHSSVTKETREKIQISACEFIPARGISSILSSGRYRCPLLKYFYKGTVRCHSLAQ